MTAFSTTSRCALSNGSVYAKLLIDKGLTHCPAFRAMQDNVLNDNYKGLLVELKKCEVDSSLACTTDFDVENITAPTYIGWG